MFGARRETQGPKLPASRDRAGLDGREKPSPLATATGRSHRLPTWRSGGLDADRHATALLDGLDGSGAVVGLHDSLQRIVPWASRARY